MRHTRPTTGPTSGVERSRALVHSFGAWAQTPAADSVGAAAFVVLVVLSGATDIGVLTRGFPESPVALCLVLVPSAAAIALRRIAPSLAFVVVWLAGLTQLATRADLFAAQLAMVLLAYSSARYGSRLIVWISAASALIGAVIATTALVWTRSWVVNSVTLATWETEMPARVVMIFTALFAALILPWMLGVIVRTIGVSEVAEQARSRAEGEAVEAKQLAALRSEHARLARDVHDVVGHSLAVIIAQAESGRYLVGGESAHVNEALRNVARTARASLAEVHQVLVRTSDPAEDRSEEPDPERLIADVRRAGHAVGTWTDGAPRALSRSADEVAYRVLQEMLTNALRHGLPDTTHVVRRWTPDALSIEVSNRVGRSSTVLVEGRGLTGMRSRLDAVDGSLRVVIAASNDDVLRFEAAARIPTDLTGGVR